MTKVVCDLDYCRFNRNGLCSSPRIAIIESEKENEAKGLPECDTFRGKLSDN